jgi:hypothetical protein
MDELLAKHFAHLFIRDPLVIFSESIDQKDDVMSDHFEVLPPLRHLTLLLTAARISNPPIGKPFVSSHPHLPRLWDGGLNSAAWRSS